MRPLSLLAMVHVIANAVLLGLGYYWLGIAEARTSSLAWSAIIALAILCIATWAYASALVYFGQETKHCAVEAWLASLRNLLPLAFCAIAILVIYFYLARWSDYSSTPATRIASYLTLTLRKPVKPAWVQNAFAAGLFAVRWIILPVFLVPMIASVGALGWRGFGAVGALVRKWLYWIETPILLLCAFAIPLKLLAWVPHVSGFGIETASFVARATIAYLLFVAGWLLLAFATSGGNPRLTQPKTVVSP